MLHLRGSVVPAFVSRCVFGACVLACSSAAYATSYELVYTGTFSTADALNLASASSPTFFTGTTTFTVDSYFDDSSPNLAPAFGGPFNGYRAYAPTLTTIDIAGVTYTIESASADPTLGVTVSIFDQNSFTPGHYAVGLIVNAPGDGAGFTGDFLSASPGFTASALTPTTFGGYAGVGYGSGVCVPNTGTSPNCTHVVTPLVLFSSNNTAYSLTLGNYEEDAPVGVVNTAQILVAVPEPSTYGLMLAGLVAVGWVARRRADRSARALA